MLAKTSLTPVFVLLVSTSLVSGGFRCSLGGKNYLNLHQTFVVLRDYLKIIKSKENIIIQNYTF